MSQDNRGRGRPAGPIDRRQFEQEVADEISLALRRERRDGQQRQQRRDRQQGPGRQR